MLDFCLQKFDATQRSLIKVVLNLQFSYLYAIDVLIDRSFISIDR